MVIWIILLIVGSQVYIAYSNSYVDTNSYLTLLKGEATLNEASVEVNKKYILVSWDKVQVIGEDGLAIIEWWDGSLTRLGGNTKISIEQNEVSRDFTDINISFELIAGKTWSNVVSFIGEDSGFTQKFEGIEAGVRGTIFDVDLDKNYLHVTDHQVSLSNEKGESAIVSEGNALELSTFSFIDISEFVANFEDAIWQQINNDLDVEYINTLKTDLSASFESGRSSFLFFLDFLSPKYRIIHELNTNSDYEVVAGLLSDVSEGQKKAVYDAILSKYQEMNFISVKDFEFYKRKIFYKKALLQLANSADKEALLRTSAYDVEDVVNSGDFAALDDVLSTFSGYSEHLGDFDFSWLGQEVDLLPESLKKEFGNSFNQLNDMFDLGIDASAFNDLDLDSIGEKAQESLDNLDEGIQNFLDKNAGGLLDKFAQ